MTENQRSGLSDKAERFQKWSQDGNISGYETSAPLGKIDDFTQNVALFFGSYSFSKKNTRHFL